MENREWGMGSGDFGYERKGTVAAWCILLCVIGLFVASCASSPQYPNPLLEESGYLPFEPGALAYIFVDVPASRPILENAAIREMGEQEARQMLDRTRSAAAALYVPAGGRRFALAAWGGYPARRVNMALGASRGWKKLRSPAGEWYWRSEERGLSLAMDTRQAFALAAASPGSPKGPAQGTEIPEGFNEFRRGAALSVWLESPGSLLNQKLREMAIPLEIPAERVFVSIIPLAEERTALPAAKPDETRYEALLQIQLASAAQARALAALFSFARNFLPADASGGPAAALSLLFANLPVQDGANLNIKTAPLTGREIALLFNVFSVH
ncbi:MAG: hypothetical protein LBD18_05510 [Treponema sp.]|jgi:hypothetical protein|nr:hypothetical protein [Treponema sp.]